MFIGDSLGGEGCSEIFPEISYLLKTAGNLSCLNRNWVGVGRDSLLCV